MDIKLGKLIASGAGTDVYEYGADKVCKLNFNKYNANDVKYEFEKTLDAYNNGLPVPKVYEIVSCNGRFGLIMERVRGVTFNDVLFEHINNCILNNVSQKETLQSSYDLHLSQIKDAANFLYKLHQKTCKLKENVKESILWHCRNNRYLRRDEKNTIEKLIEDLPDSNNVCHGDPNPNNFMYVNNDIHMIDWVDCVNAHPFYDLTEFKLMTLYADPPDDKLLPEYIISFHLRNLDNYVKTFLDEYKKISDIDLSGMEKWTIPVLVFKMGGNNSGERQRRLLAGISEGLSKL